MNKEIKAVLFQYSNNKKNISCSKALDAAAFLGVKPENIGKAASKYGLKIVNCELAQFGNKRVGKFDKDVYEELKKYADIHNQITCADALKVAEKYGIFKVRSTIKNSYMKVVYCQLGCFRQRKGLRLKVKTKLWIENKDVGMALGDGTAQILELIDKKGSIAAAADAMGLSYKKVWSQIRTLQNTMNKKYVITTKGRGSGGSVITDDAKDFVKKFRKMQREVIRYTNNKFIDIFYSDRKFEKEE